jgi:hypothetical protein
VKRVWVSRPVFRTTGAYTGHPPEHPWYSGPANHFPLTALSL